MDLPDFGIDFARFPMAPPDLDRDGPLIAARLMQEPEIASAVYNTETKAIDVTLTPEPLTEIIVDHHVAVDGNDVTVTWRAE